MKPFRCQLCQYGSLTKQKVERHLANRHKGQLFQGSGIIHEQQPKLKPLSHYRRHAPLPVTLVEAGSDEAPGICKEESSQSPDLIESHVLAVQQQAGEVKSEDNLYDITAVTSASAEDQNTVTHILLEDGMVAQLVIPPDGEQAAVVHDNGVLENCETSTTVILAE